MSEPKTLHHKALDHSDDIGAFFAAIVGLAGIFNLPARLGITVDELAMALGFGFTIIAYSRGRMEKKYKTRLRNAEASSVSVPVEVEDGKEITAPIPNPPTDEAILPPPPTIGKP